MAHIASTWPFKSSYKTNIILYILQLRPLDDKKWCAAKNAFCIKNCPTCILKNQISEFEAQFWHSNKHKIIKNAGDVWSKTAFLIYQNSFEIYWNSMKKHCNLPSNWLLRSRKNASHIALKPPSLKLCISQKRFKTYLIFNISVDVRLK